MWKVGWGWRKYVTRDVSQGMCLVMAPFLLPVSCHSCPLRGKQSSLPDALVTFLSAFLLAQNCKRWLVLMVDDLKLWSEIFPERFSHSSEKANYQVFHLLSLLLANIPLFLSQLSDLFWYLPYNCKYLVHVSSNSQNWKVDTYAWWMASTGVFFFQGFSIDWGQERSLTSATFNGFSFASASA